MHEHVIDWYLSNRQGRLYFSENDTLKHSQSGDLGSLTIARNIIISYHGNIIQPFPPTDTHACTLDLSLEALQITRCRCVVLKVFKCLRMKWAGTSCMHQLKEGWEKQGVDFPGQMIVFYPSMCCQTTSAGEGWGGGVGVCKLFFCLWRAVLLVFLECIRCSTIKQEKKYIFPGLFIHLLSPVKILLNLNDAKVYNERQHPPVCQSTVPKQKSMSAFCTPTFTKFNSEKTLGPVQGYCDYREFKWAQISDLKRAKLSKSSTP